MAIDAGRMGTEVLGFGGAGEPGRTEMMDGVSQSFNIARSNARPWVLDGSGLPMPLIGRGRGRSCTAGGNWASW